MRPTAPDGFVVRPYLPGDRAEMVRMFAALFPDSDAESEVTALAAKLGDSYGLFVLARPGGGLGGFVEVGTRPYAEGCDSSPVAYLEAWYIDPDLRRRRLGARLVAAVEDWALRRGHRELASDAVLDNEISHAAHRALGFDETERIVCYRKPL
jgi:aminoglycoside 6'-N-acetyltransferase I